MGQLFYLWRHRADGRITWLFWINSNFSISMWGLPMKKFIMIFLLTLYCNNTKTEWVEYSTRTNGDIYFFDNARVQTEGNLLHVWIRIQYTSSVMGAWSYQSLTKIDCSEHTEITLQNTFYTDKNWIIPAMETNATEKPKVHINEDSATKRLTDILCNWWQDRFFRSS